MWKVFALTAALIGVAPANAALLSGNGAHRSQVNINGTNQNITGGNIFINYLKSSNGWMLSGVPATPSQLDQNGWPLTGVVNPIMSWWQPQAAERPGHYVATWVGSGEIAVQPLSVGPQNTSNISCNGAFDGTGFCKNTTCTGVAGYIAGNVLTVTNAPAVCTLPIGVPVGMSSGIASGTYNSTTGAVSLTLSQDVGVGVGATVIVSAIGAGTPGPIQQLNGTFTTTAGTSGTTLNYTAPTGLGSLSVTSGDVESTHVNTFGVPTIIIGNAASGAQCSGIACTGAGGTGTYLLNFSQTIGSSGSHVNLYPGGRFEYVATGWVNSTTIESWRSFISTTTAGNRVRWMGVYHVNDETDYDDQNLTPLGTLTQSVWRNAMKSEGFAVFRDLGTSDAVKNNVSNWSSTRSPQYAFYSGYEQRPNIYAGIPTYALTGNINQYTMSWQSGPPSDKQMIIFKIPNALQSLSALDAVTFVDPGTIADGAYVNIPVTTLTGSGSGATAAVVNVHNNQIVYIAFNSAGGGSGYAVGNTLSLTVGGKTVLASVTSTSQLAYNTQISIDGGSTYQQVAWLGGGPIYALGFMPNGDLISATFDASSGFWVLDGFGGGSNGGGIYNPVPPAAFVQMCAEANASPWSVEPTLAADYQSDYPKQYATYVFSNYPWMHPWFEPPNEQWNAAQTQFTSSYNKGLIWQNQDTTNWGADYNLIQLVNDEYGKIASTLGQAVYSFYGRGQAEVLAGVQTPTGDTYGDALGSAFRVTSVAYVNQTITPQVGYIKAPAYNYVTRTAIVDYWGPAISYGSVYNSTNSNEGTLGETPLAYQWFFGSAATRSSLMATYGGYGIANIGNNNTWYQSWDQFSTSCGGTNVSPCNIKGIAAYEGGNDSGNSTTTGAAQASDTTQPVSGAVNATQCILQLGPLPIYTSGASQFTFTGSITGTTFSPTGFAKQWNFSPGMLLTGTGLASPTTITGYAPDGNGRNMLVTPSQTTGSVTNMQFYGNAAVIGMSTLALSSVVNGGGGSWSTTPGAYQNLVVSAVNSTTVPPTITISNLDCSGLGALASATLTYVGSANWVTTMRYESYAAQPIGNVDAVNYATFVAAGGVNPSQSNEVAGGFYPWFLENFDIYGWYPEGNCTSCTISGSSLTLGGTVTGEFLLGQSVLGKGVATLGNSAANTTITACSTVTSNPCGTTSGDVLTLSQAAFANFSGVSIGSFSQSPLASWLAIKHWNGGFLLKRDLDPASNDNSLAFVYQAA